jgi:hypothetical protein
MGRKRQSIEGWIEEARTDVDKTGKLRAIVLVHRVGAQGASTELHNLVIGDRDLKSKDMAEMFQAKAESFAQDLPGVQIFNLLGFYGENTAPEAVHPFTAQPFRDPNDHDGMFTEAPTAEGRTMQRMRHEEMFVQQVFRRQQAQDEYAIRFMEQASRQMEHMNHAIVALRQESSETFTVVRDLMIAQADKTHAYEMAKMKAVTDAQERKMWMSLLPPMANMVTGKKIFPESIVSQNMLESIIDHLSPEDVTAIASKLPPHVVAPMMDYLVKRQEQKQREQLEIERSVPMENDPALQLGPGPNGEAH